jgi:hypothetical protein
MVVASHQKHCRNANNLAFSAARVNWYSPKFWRNGRLPHERLDDPSEPVLGLILKEAFAMQVEIPDELSEVLVQTAAASGSDPEQVAIAAIRRGLDEVKQLEEVLAPVRDAYRASGLSEQQAVELFEAEKHAARRERRGIAT